MFLKRPRDIPHDSRKEAGQIEPAHCPAPHLHSPREALYSLARIIIGGKIKVLACESEDGEAPSASNHVKQSASKTSL